jgi:hypothetical protein
MRITGPAGHLTANVMVALAERFELMTYQGSGPMLRQWRADPANAGRQMAAWQREDRAEDRARGREPGPARRYPNLQGVHLDAPPAPRHVMRQAPRPAAARRSDLVADQEIGA